MVSLFWVCGLAVLAVRRLTPRTGLSILVAVSVFLAYAARQNGLAIAPVLFYAALEAWPRIGQPYLSKVYRAALSLVLTGAVFVLMSAVLAIAGVERSTAGAVTPIFDLARLSVREDKLLIPEEINPTGLTLAEISEVSTRFSMQGLYLGPKGVPIFLTGPQQDAVMSAWKDQILNHPVDYLRMRWQLFSRQLGWSGDTRFAYLPPEIENVYGVTATFPGLSARATAYMQTFNSGPTWPESGVAYRAWPALLAMCAAMSLALKRRWDSIIVVAGASSILYAFSAFLLAPELSSRMISPSAIIGMICATALLRAIPSSEQQSDQIPATSPRNEPIATGPGAPE